MVVLAANTAAAADGADAGERVMQRLSWQQMRRLRRAADVAGATSSAAPEAMADAPVADAASDAGG